MKREGHQFLHNHGRNRWFDKSFSLLGAKGGDVAVHFEHSWGDGVCVVRYAEEIFADQKNVPSARSGGSIDSPVKLEWDLDDKISQSLQKSEDTFRKVADSLQLKVFFIIFLQSFLGSFLIIFFSIPIQDNCV